MMLGDAPMLSVAVGDAVGDAVSVVVDDTDCEAPTVTAGVGVPDLEPEKERESVPVLQAEREGELDAVAPCESVDVEVRDTVGETASVEEAVGELGGVLEGVLEAVLESVLEGFDPTQASEEATLLQAYTPHKNTSWYTEAKAGEMNCAAVAVEMEVKARAFVPAGCPAHAALASVELHVNV